LRNRSYDAIKRRTGSAVNENRNKAAKMLPVQCKMARTALGLGIREVAELAKVSSNTVSRLEAGEELKPRTIAAIRAAFELAGVEFIAENGGGAGVRLRKGAAG
jgi:transcriptional regulator with XRE-family HTH domain